MNKIINKKKSLYLFIASLAYFFILIFGFNIFFQDPLSFWVIDYISLIISVVIFFVVVDSIFLIKKACKDIYSIFIKSLPLFNKDVQKAKRDSSKKSSFLLESIKPIFPLILFLLSVLINNDNVLQNYLMTFSLLFFIESYSNLILKKIK
jgi:hypothetical protein